MTEVMELKKSNLVLPKHFVELDREEMCYVTGGASFSWIKSIFGLTVGIEIKLSGYETEGLVKALAVGMGVSAFAAFIPGAMILAGIIIAVLGVYAAWIDLVNWKNNYNGVTISTKFLPAFFTVW
jgi:hypothetical protein